MTDRLSAAQIQEQLKGAGGWKLEGDAIRKQFVFESFMPAIGFVNRVAELAEAADHHPDIMINYRKVTLVLSTHSEGGLTQKDFALARKIEGTANKQGK